MVLTQYVIRTDKIKVPCKFVVISDFHNRLRYATPALNLARYAKPDAILVAGDLVDRHKKTSDLALPFLSECVTIAPTFFAYGNHEVKFPELSKADFERTGATVLCNEFTEFISGAGDTYIVGGQVPFEGFEWIHDMEKSKNFKILLCHRPESYIKNFKNCHVDLAVAGHAHGGQIRIKDHGILSPDQGLLPKFTKGIYDGKLVVSTGISNTGGIVPRLGNPEEVVLISVVPTGNSN